MDEFTSRSRDITVVELLDRLLDNGVVLSGEIRLSVADVDLIELGLRLMIRTPDDSAPRGTIEQPAERQKDTDDLSLRLRPATEGEPDTR